MDKKELRKEILEKRKELSPSGKQELDDKIYRRLTALEEIENAHCVMAYASYNSEADTTRLVGTLLERGRMVALPKVCGDDMNFYLISSPDDLQSGYKGIPEPAEGCNIYLPDSDAGECDVILVPGSAFDRRLYRMGYGKGYYDRYLTAHKGPVRIGLAYDFQILDAVPTDEWDVKLDMIVTDSEIIR